MAVESIGAPAPRQTQSKMDDVWLDRILRLIVEHDSFIVPVRWLLRQLGPLAPMSETELIRFFEDDDRFQVFTGLDFDGDDGPIAQFSLSEQEAMGIFQGPKVMLKDRMPSRQQIVDFLINKADQTYHALLRAWEIRPPEDGQVEDQLLGALAKAQRLQRELRAVLDA